MEFPPTFVINLAERSDRLESVRTSFSNWPVPVERFNAVKLRPGWKGCLASHKKLLEFAKEKGYPYILILEDDCELTPNGQERFQQLLPILQQRSSEWDVFLGGVTYLDDVRVIQDNPPLFQVSANTTHFCLFNANGVRKVLQNWHENDPYDVFLRRNVRIWCTSPHIAIQSESYSDITKLNADYSHEFLTASKTLQRSLSTNTNIVILGIAIAASLLILRVRYAK